MLTIRNNASVNKEVPISLWNSDFVSFNYIPRSGIAVLYGSSGHGTTDWLQIRKGVRQGCVLLPCLFNLYAEYIMRNAGLEEAQAGIKTAGRNISNLLILRNINMQMTPPLWRKVKKN